MDRREGGNSSLDVIIFLQVRPIIYGHMYLQKEDDIIMMVMLKIRQNLVDEKFSHPLNLENL